MVPVEVIGCFHCQLLVMLASAYFPKHPTRPRQVAIANSLNQFPELLFHGPLAAQPYVCQHLRAIKDLRKPAILAVRHKFLYPKAFG